jgi:hypothetical protein
MAADAAPSTRDTGNTGAALTSGTSGERTRTATSVAPSANDPLLDHLRDQEQRRRSEDVERREQELEAREAMSRTLETS